MLGNLEKYELSADNNICQFWGFFPDARDFSPLLGILNRYLAGWNIYGQPQTNWAEFAAILEQHPDGAKRLQDNPGGIESFLPYLQAYQAYKVAEEELMTLSLQHFAPSPPPLGVSIRRATLADLPTLTEFYANAEHMKRTAPAVEQPLRHTRIWLAEWRGAVLSAALTNAESKGLAMIGGVYTIPNARNQGLSRAVCSALCAELIAGRKQPVLYWETPAAGALYRRLGFKGVGTWRSVHLAPVKHPEILSLPV
jgi:GNAT superfamily N-acetyltransferase